MSSVSKLFKELDERLSFFLYKGELVRYDTYDFESVITGIKAGIDDLPQEQAVKKLTGLLRGIQKLKNSGADFSQYFYDPASLEQEDYWNFYGLRPEEYDVIKEPISSAILKQAVHTYIIKEFNAYQAFIERTLHRLKGEKEGTIIEVFSYKGEPEELTDMLKTLQKRSLVSKLETPARFKRVFTGGKPPKQKVVWIGTAPELNEFIKQLHKKGMVMDTKKRKWSITKACFRFEDNSKNTETIGDQTLEDEAAIKLINGILEPYEELLLIRQELLDHRNK